VDTAAAWVHFAGKAR